MMIWWWWWWWWWTGERHKRTSERISDIWAKNQVWNFWTETSGCCKTDHSSHLIWIGLWLQNLTADLLLLKVMF